MINRVTGRLHRAAFDLRAAPRRLKVQAAVRRDVRVPPPSAFARFGDDSWIVPPARVNSPHCIEVGSGVVILENSWLAVFPQGGLPAPLLRIGDRVHLGRSAHIACVGEVIIGDDVLTADNIFIADTYHGYENKGQPIIRQPMAPPAPVVIEKGAFLGIRSAILRGVTIGENAYVGAGAVVFDDVPPRSVAVGNPARVVRLYDERTGEWEPVSGS
jgi:acetyltransferase-like isoleucine patch superfamily enzyme